MIHTTLAHNMRPESLDEVLGQKHLVAKGAILRQFVAKKHPMSVIFYGPPGCGKTTMAKALAHDLKIPCRLFNASTGNKKEMDQIIMEAKMSDGLFVIIDEVHRLNKDKQDHLLPHIESGLITIAGCTTANPYHAINPAIRSRCTILKVANASANVRFDKDEDHYYDTLSGFQKSIRGSDVNGALYYLGKLIEAGDLESLERRLITTAYEDVGLANPNACMRTVIACQAAHTIGFPEARIPLASAVIELALSQKTKSSEAGIDAALESLHEHEYEVPPYLRLSPVGLSDEEKYAYDRPDIWEYLQYLPTPVAHEQFYVPWMTSRYEKMLAENYERILKHGRTNDIVTLKKRKK